MQTYTTLCVLTFTIQPSHLLIIIIRPMNIMVIAQSMSPSTSPIRVKENGIFTCMLAVVFDKNCLPFPRFKKLDYLGKSIKKGLQLKAAFSSLNCLTFSQHTAMKAQSEEQILPLRGFIK